MSVEISELPDVIGDLLGDEWLAIVKDGITSRVSLTDILVSGGNVKFARINATADGDNTVIAAVIGLKIRVVGYVVVGSVSGIISFKSGATILSSYPVAANGGASYAGGPNAPAFETGVNTALIINNTAGLDTTGHLAYIEV